MLETFVAIMLVLGLLTIKLLFIIAALVGTGLVLDWIRDQRHPEVVC